MNYYDKPTQIDKRIENNHRVIRDEIDLMNELYEHSEPYAYLVTHKITKQFYVGCQYGLTAKPSNLGTTYFTSGYFKAEFAANPDRFDIEYLYKTPYWTATYWERAWNACDKERSFINGNKDNPLCVNGSVSWYTSPSSLLKSQWDTLEQRATTLYAKWEKEQAIAREKQERLEMERKEELQREWDRVWSENEQKQAKSLEWKPNTKQSMELLKAMSKDRVNKYQTTFWKDLRDKFRSEHDARIQARLKANELSKTLNL